LTKSNPEKNPFENNPERKEGLLNSDNHPHPSSSSSSSESSSSDDDQSASSSNISGDNNDFDQIEEPLDSIEDMDLNGDDALQDLDEPSTQVEDIEDVEPPSVPNKPSHQDRRLPSCNNNCVPSLSAQLIYHGLFTSFQCHVLQTDEDKLLLRKIFLQQQCLKVIPKNNNHILECNQEDLSWSKPIAKKKPSDGYDEEIVGVYSV
jgi:hypothetical protein